MWATRGIPPIKCWAGKYRPQETARSSLILRLGWKTDSTKHHLTRRGAPWNGWGRGGWKLWVEGGIWEWKELLEWKAGLYLDVGNRPSQVHRLWCRCGCGFTTFSITYQIPTSTHHYYPNHHIYLPQDKVCEDHSIFALRFLKVSWPHKLKLICHFSLSIIRRKWNIVAQHTGTVTMAVTRA